MEKIKFENNEEKLKHIGLMCCTNLHDAFSNLSSIISLCNDKTFTEKEKMSLIKEKANATYELFRTIERYRNQQEKSETKTFLASDLGKMMEKYFSLDCAKCEMNLIKDFEITCQKTLLVQALVNLIDNGFKHNDNKYTDNFGTTKYRDKKVLLTINENEIIVSDNGNGIPAENKDKIFDLFFTTKDLDKLYGEHNGIGLYGVKEHIKSLGYSIEVDNNTILKGANFKIKIK